MNRITMSSIIERKKEQIKANDKSLNNLIKESEILTQELFMLEHLFDYSSKINDKDRLKMLVQWKNEG